MRDPRAFAVARSALEEQPWSDGSERVTGEWAEFAARVSLTYS